MRGEGQWEDMLNAIADDILDKPDREKIIKYLEEVYSLGQDSTRD